MAVSNSTDRFNGVIASLAIKAPCVAVAIANLTLSGEQTVNGVAVVAGDRVLVTAQTNATENGIYDASSSAWARSADWDGNRDVVSGTFVTVATATVGRNPFYQVTTANPITIGTTAVNFTLADGANVSYALTTAEDTEGLTTSDIDDSLEPGTVTRYKTNTTPGTTDMTPAYQTQANLATSHTPIVPPDTYAIDLDNPILVGSNYNISGYGSTLKAIGKSYAFTTSAFFRNSASVVYDVGEARESNIHIAGFRFDGNIANVTFSASGGISGIVLFQADDCTIRDVTMVDLPGVNGQGYGIIARFCENFVVDHLTTNRTDRQAIVFWETTGEIRTCDLTHSYEREPILISSDAGASPSYQRAYAVIDNCILDNSATTNGDNCVRFSGHSSGAVRDCRMKGTALLRGIYITDVREHDVDMFHNDFDTFLYGILVESASKKTLHCAKNRYQNCENGLRANAASTNGLITVEKEHFDAVSIQPIYINSFDNVNVQNIYINGGSTACFVGNYKSLHLLNWNIVGMTDATRVLNVSTAASGNEKPVINGIITRGNTADSINIAEASYVSNIDATQTGAGAGKGSFTGTLTGCTSSPTGSVEYTFDGDVVNLEIPAVSATSNTTAATVTGMPTLLRPAANQTVVGITQDNGTTAFGKLIIGTDGVITLHVGQSTVFTASGTKGIAACSISYRVK